VLSQLFGMLCSWRGVRFLRQQLRLSLRSHLAIWRFLCCALRAARLFSAAACFWLKIVSSGRGALVGTRWAHFNCDDKEAR
jgi:hypothetical protein